MKYLNKFSKFFKRKKVEKKIPFEQILTNFKKFIDFECPEEIEVKYTISDYNWKRGHPYPVIQKSIVLKISDVRIEDVDRTKTIDGRKFGPRIGRVEIYLLQDQLNYILISIPYDEQKKFDIIDYNLTDQRTIRNNHFFYINLIKDGKIIEPRNRYPHQFDQNFKNLKDSIRDYLVKKRMAVSQCRE